MKGANGLHLLKSMMTGADNKKTPWTSQPGTESQLSELYLRALSMQNSTQTVKKVHGKWQGDENLITKNKLVYSKTCPPPG